jgi:oligoribonuclease
MKWWGKMSDLLLWVDCEMTGLSEADELIEFAVVPTDKHIKLLDDNTGIDIVIKPSPQGLESLKANSYVHQMHTKSGLLAKLDGGMEIEKAEETVLEYVTKFIGHSKTHNQTGKILLAGNSVHVDKRFIDKYMPKFAQLLHYRLIDVSTIKELARAWYPKISRKAIIKNSSHRAMDDILESIQELQYYREQIFIPN